MGKNKLTRFQENENFKHVFQPRFNEVYQKDYYLKGKWATGFFKNSNPIVLELGCGKGEYTTELGSRFPQINFIGVDIKGARLWRGARTAFERNLKNVAFVRSGIELIDSIFGENEISEIWLTFSDPQPKRVKKRLSSTNFLKKYQAFLKREAIIHLKTDNQLLFEYTKALVEKNNLFSNFISTDVYNDTNLPGVVREIQTFYEKQFLNENKKIYYIEFKLDNIIQLIEPEEFIESEALRFR